MRWPAVTLTLAALAAPAAAGERYALLVGVNNSLVDNVTTLKYAVPDVTAMDEILKKLGYAHTTVLRDDAASRKNVLKALSYYARRTEPGDEFLVFYAGHGVRNSMLNSKTYWLTFGAEIASLDESAIRLPHLMDYVRDVKAGRKLVMLDHCYAGEIVPELMEAVSAALGSSPAAAPPPASSRNASPRNARLSKGVQVTEDDVQKETEAPGLVVVTAARTEAFEYDDLKHGALTYALKQALTTREADRNDDTRLSVVELLDYLKAKVRKLSEGKSQVVDDFLTGINTTNWYITDRLPVKPTEIASKAAAYKALLDGWAQSERIGWDIHATGKQVLDRWAATTAPAAPPLSAVDQQILDGIRTAVDGVGQLEEDRTRELVRVVTDALRQ